MGQALGCCGNNEAVDIKNEHKILGNEHLERFKTEHFLSMIIRLQSNFRGYLARKKVQKIHKELYNMQNID